MRLAARVHLGESGRAYSSCVRHGTIRGLLSRFHRSFGRTPLLLLTGASFILLPPDLLPAQAPVVRIRPAQDQAQTNTADYFAAVLHPSEEATTLLSRAQEGASRQDWKLVVDSYQRIIELPGDHILATNDTKHESARQHAQRQLAALPPDGLRAYRLIYDGEATAIFSRSVEQHDETGLRRLIDRSFLTSKGDDAAVTLADWLIDEGRFLEAGMFLRLVQDVYPDSDLPAWAVPVRLAVCLAGMSRMDQAKTLLDETEAKQAADSSEAAARVIQVREYLGRTSQPSAPEPSFGWPMAYGRSSRDGNMSPVEPTFISHLPWNVSLPVPQPKSGIGAMEDYAAARQLLPAAEVTTNGRIIVAKSGANLLGLDRDTFDPLWTTRNEDEDADLIDLDSPGTFGMGQVWPGAVERSLDERFAADPQMRRLYYDSVGNQVCLAAGLAVTVEWPGEPPDTLAARTNRGTRRQSMPMAGTVQSHPNFVVAYSTQDGRRVWTSDTTAGPNALGPVEFLSAPIVVENQLLVPCRVNDDIYAVLLDPETGKISRHIYLCGTGGAPFDSLYSCMPCAADGIVFVPTGRGVLVAIDTASWSIRWATRYDQLNNPVNEITWMPTPAIAVADVVLLAPPDADELLCFDRASGNIRWHTPRNKAMYVLAAGDGLAWTVGEEAAAIELESGKSAWRTPCGTPGGRGARSGDLLYLPTRSGLKMLNARTGELAKETPANVTPGNLLAYEDSLYIVSAFEIHKYPDMKRGYNQALAAHQQNPIDMSLAMRLAWLEFLRGEPDKALTALSQVPEHARTQDEKRYGRLVHLKVLSMLELAALPSSSPDEASNLLQKAQQIAQTSEDIITARLALGEHYARGGVPDGNLKGCVEYATLAFDPTGDEILTEQGDSTFERQAGLVASRRLTDLLPKLSAQNTEELMAILQQRLEQAIQTRNTGQLRRISNCNALARLSVQADLALAVWAAKDLAYEQAEACLQRVIRRAESPDLVAEALARLAAIHLQPGELHLPVSGTELARRLEKEFADVQIPASILESEWPVNPAGGKSSGRLLSGSEMSRALLKRVDDRIRSEHEERIKPISIGSPGNPPEVTNYANARPIVTRGQRSEALADRMLLFVEDRTVEARRVDDGQLLWPAELRLLGEMSVESRTTADGNRLSLPRMGPSEPARGLVEGQTLIVNTRFGVHAVGLLTGRRLWSRRFDPPAKSDQSPAGSDAYVWVHDGFVISVDNYSRLEVARFESGADILWRRRMLDRRWQTVRAVGDFLVVGDARLQQVDVFRISDGTHLGVCEFAQQPEPDRAVNVAVLADAICGPVSPRTVAAMELNTPGVERWRIDMDSELSQIFKPSEDTLAVADRSGRVKLIDPASGKVTMDVRIPVCAKGVVDGRIEAGVLYVYGLEKRFEPSRGSTERQQWSLAAVRVNNGEILWSKGELGPQLCLTTEALAASPNAIPIVAYRPASGEARMDYGNGPVTIATSRRAAVELMVLDKATGAKIGDTANLEVEATDGAAILLDLQVWPNRVTAFVGTNYLEFNLLPPGNRATLSPAEAEDHPGSGL